MSDLRLKLKQRNNLNNNYKGKNLILTIHEYRGKTYDIKINNFNKVRSIKGNLVKFYYGNKQKQIIDSSEIICIDTKRS